MVGDCGSVTQLYGQCGVSLNDGNILNFDVNVGTTSRGNVMLPEAEIENEVDPGCDHASQVHPVPEVEQLVDHPGTREFRHKAP